MTELELLAQVWVGGDGGGMERAVLEVERSDRDEVRLGVTEGDETTHVYLAPDRAVRLAQALIFEASREWRLP
jgi:hypothetical protein